MLAAFLYLFLPDEFGDGHMAVMSQTVQSVCQLFCGQAMIIIDPTQDQTHGTGKNKIVYIVQIHAVVLGEFLTPTVHYIGTNHLLDSFDESGISVFAHDDPTQIPIFQNSRKKRGHIQQHLHIQKFLRLFYLQL